MYRLNADLNPLHIDPQFAAMAGFKKPILHGLATLGIAIKHVSELYCNEDPGNVRRFKARFARPVYPGQTVR